MNSRVTATSRIFGSRLITSGVPKTLRGAAFRSKRRGSGFASLDLVGVLAGVDDDASNFTRLEEATELIEGEHCVGWLEDLDLFLASMMSSKVCFLLARDAGTMSTGSLGLPTGPGEGGRGGGDSSRIWGGGAGVCMETTASSFALAIC